MQLKTSFKKILLVVVILGLSLLSLFLLFSPKETIQSNTIPSTVNANVALIKEQPDCGLPMRLRISAINVDAQIEYVGLTSDGTMDVPKNPANVAWLMTGEKPGENGSAVIAGHYGAWKNGEGSVFDNLYKLNKGDQLFVEDDQGAIISFVVSEKREYDPTANVADVFASDDGKSHLNLITCDGTWNNAAKSYSKRLVVFAEKE